MLYAIIATDNTNSLELRSAARPAHLERLQALQDSARLILAGPHPAIDSSDPGAAGFSGSSGCCRVCIFTSGASSGPPLTRIALRVFMRMYR